MQELIKRPEYEASVTSAKDAFIKVAGEQKWDIEVIFALQAIRNSDLLQKCSNESIRNAVVNVGLTGVTLNPLLQQAFLIPRKGKAVLDISYRGLVKIAVDAGSVYDIDAVPVYEGDDFYFEQGLNPKLEHIPKLFDDDKGKNLIAVYAVATIHHGLKKFVVLDKEKIERAKRSSQTDKVWKEHFDEMAKKTAVKLLYKLLPQQTDKMSSATAILNEHEGIAGASTAKADDVMKRFEEKKEQTTDTFKCAADGKLSVTLEICGACPEKEKGGEPCVVWLERQA